MNEEVLNDGWYLYEEGEADGDGPRLSHEQEVIILDNVRRGAALLDEYRPGWHYRVIPSKLHMTNRKYCILGQIGDEYGRELRRLLEDTGLVATDDVSEQSFVHGFTSRNEVMPDEGNYWSFLTTAWIEEIERRRSGGYFLEDTINDGRLGRREA